MSQSLLLVTVGYIVFATANIWRRPGFFAAIYLLTYGLAAFFGSIGPIAGAVSLLTSIAAINSAGEQQKILGPEYPFLLWVLLMALSLFTSPQIDITAVYVASVVLLASGSYLYARAFASHPTFFQDLLLGSVIVNTLCAMQFFLTSRGLGIIGAALNMSHVGLAVLPELCLAGSLSFLLFHRSHSRTTTIAILLFMLAVLGPLTLGLGTRSLILSMGIAFAVLLAFRAWHGGVGRILRGITASAVFLGAVITIFWSSIAQSKLGLLISLGGARLLSGAATGDIQSDPSSLIRLQLYAEAWDLFLRHPIFGNGAGSFGYLADNAGGAYPHNMILELIVQSGVFGLLLFLAFCIPLGIRGFRDMLQKPASWAAAFAAAIFISALVRHQVSMSITQGKLLFFALGCFAARWIAEQKTVDKSHVIHGTHFNYGWGKRPDL